MEWAELVLEYVKVLAWPLVVAGVIFGFRRQIATKIKDLTGVSTPVGDATFDRAARQVEEQTDRIVARQDDEVTSTDESSDPTLTHGDLDAWKEHVDERLVFIALTNATERLVVQSDFGLARDIAEASPNASIMLAFSELEKTARAAATMSDMAPPPASKSAISLVRSMAGAGLDSEFVQVAEELVSLRNRIANGADEASRHGALDFVAACERLSEAMRYKAISKLRHPSRSQIVGKWQEWLIGRPRTADDV